MRVPGTSFLSFEDEEIVIRARQGELPFETAEALGHPITTVARALNRAWLLGIPTRPDAAPADGRASLSRRR